MGGSTFGPGPVGVKIGATGIKKLFSGQKKCSKVAGGPYLGFKFSSDSKSKAPLPTVNLTVKEFVVESSEVTLKKLASPNGVGL